MDLDKIEKPKRKRQRHRYCRDCRKWIIEQLGNKCQRCGFDESIVALDIHTNNHRHIDRKHDYIEWFETKQIPADAVVLCANCHRILTYDSKKF